MKKSLLILLWSVLTIILLCGMALRPTWNDSDYYIELVNMAAVGIKPHVDYPHIYTLLSTWIMIPFKAALGELFSPTTMSVLVGLFYLIIARLVFSMLKKLECPALAAHAGAALTAFLAISSGHLQFTLEPWCVLFGTIAMWFVICGRATTAWAVLTGVCTAATFLCKQNGGIFLPAVFVLAWCFLPKKKRISYLVVFVLAVFVTLASYLIGTRLWLGDWSAVPAFFGRVPYSRSLNIAKNEATETLVKTLLWCWPVWLAAALAWKKHKALTVALFFGCLLLVPAVVVSPGDHNRYYIAPFLGLLLGLGWPQTKRLGWLMLCAFGIYSAETMLRCAVYLPEPLQNFCNHGSVYSKDDLELVDALRLVLKPSDRLLVVPKDGGESVARFYVLSRAVPVSLDIRHQTNLGWGTEFIYGDDDYRLNSCSNATVWAIHKSTDFLEMRNEVLKLSGKPVCLTANWEISRR